MLLPRPISLHDVVDVEAFVNATLNKSELGFLPAEREDLVAEGIALMVDLAQRYTPHRAGYAQPGRFSGYAAAFLPKRLGDAWHRLHEEHRYVTDPVTGKRDWHYDQPVVSLNALVEERFLLGSRRPAEFVPLPIPSRAVEDS